MIRFIACAAVAAAQPSLLPPPLLVYWSATHQDNVVVATTASIASLDPTYCYIDTDLNVVFNASTSPGAGFVPLNFYFNAATQHHMTTASDAGNAWAKANGYTFLRTEGWVVPANASDPSMSPLEMWYSSARGDHFLVGTAENRANAVAAGYVLQYIDCYVPLSWVSWPNQPPANIPFAKSTDLTGYELAWGTNAVTPGIGADTWYPSWAADGNLYSSWTDGTVDGHGSGSGGHGATTGFATIIGDNPFNLTLANVSVFAEPADPYQGRYPSLSFHHGGVWYYGTYSLENFEPGVSPGPDCGNWCVQGPFTEIRYSLDGSGATWVAPRRNMTSWSDNLFGETAFNNTKVKFGAPHAVDFGQENAASPDGRLYIVGHGAEFPTSYQSWMEGDSVYMARTKNPLSPGTYATINNADAWEFYAGGSGPGAVWSGNLSAAQPLFVWVNRTGVVTLSWHEALGKYIMVISTPTTPPYTIYDFDTYFLESDSLTGPWSYVTYMQSFGPQAYFVNIPSKFMTATPYRLSTMHQQNAPMSLPVVDADAALRLDPNIVPAEASIAESAAILAPHLLQPVTPVGTVTDFNVSGDAAAASFYNFFLSYSANFASGYAPNPPGSGYHWCLQASRFGLTASGAEKASARAQVVSLAKANGAEAPRAPL